MDIDKARKIVEFLEDCGVEASLTEDYSGRGRYGRTTAAVVVDDPMEVAYAAGYIDGSEDPDAEYPGFREDSVGRKTVVY